MTVNADLWVHFIEVAAIIFWVGVSYGDLRWIKGELRYLRKRFDNLSGRIPAHNPPLKEDTDL